MAHATARGRSVPPLPNPKAPQCTNTILTTLPLNSATYRCDLLLSILYFDSIEVADSRRSPSVAPTRCPP